MIKITNNGVNISSAEEVLANVQESWQSALGQNINLAPETPQGQLMTSQAAMIIDKDTAILDFVNQINPATATGAMQDAIGAIYFIERKPARPSIVNLVCKGLRGTRISGKHEANPSFARSENGDIFVCTNGGVIPESRSIELQFESVEKGDILAEAGKVRFIHRALPGWESCYNPMDGTSGVLAETPSQFEARRKRAIAKNATGSVAAIESRILDIEDVIDCKVFENPTRGERMIGSVSLKPHSVYISVDGGSDRDIGFAIYESKSAGCDMNGNTSVMVVDAASGAENTMIFQRVEPIDISVKVIVSDNLPDSIKESLPSAIYDSFMSNRPTIGGTIFASQFYYVGISGILSIEIARGGSAGFGHFITSEINEVFSLRQQDIKVVS
jgi:uncharacterized phage protein gp47/JayE